jgi:hypothetical protein
VRNGFVVFRWRFFALVRRAAFRGRVMVAGDGGSRISEHGVGARPGFVASAWSSGGCSLARSSSSAHYQRLFEPAAYQNGLPHPRHLSREQYLALARSAALRGARGSGVPASRVEVELPSGGFAPTRELRSARQARPAYALRERPARERIPVDARATAEILPDSAWRSASPRPLREVATTVHLRTRWAS